VTPTNSTVLISGETGTGKEPIARAIHSASPRAQRALIKVNRAALSEGLVASELFGEALGIPPSTLESRIRRLGIDKHAFRRRPARARV
jgi:formate hydrogenlyase transcriptional activator